VTKANKDKRDESGEGQIEGERQQVDTRLLKSLDCGREQRKEWARGALF
jgi:hypothetical protein